MTEDEKNDTIDANDPYRTFFLFNNSVSEHGAQAVWDKIYRFFQAIGEWYENRSLYNYAGFIIAADGNSSIKKLMDETSQMGKDRRLEFLQGKVANLVKLPGKRELADLLYGKDYELIKRILLWFNIKTMENSGERFPFERYKAQDASWSLEHIHARNSQGLSKQEAWREWLRLNVKALEDLPDRDEELIAEVQAALQKTAITEKIFDNFFKRITEKFTDDSPDNVPDSIMNLALLRSDSNSALSNSVFNAKRALLIELDRQGHFIPVCTRNVFMKYYSPDGKNLPYFWGREDRKAYRDEIARVVYDEQSGLLPNARGEQG